MKTLLVKTVCTNTFIHTTQAHPLSIPGDYHSATVQIRRIINIPDNINNWQVIKLFNLTCDITGLSGTETRLTFDYSELGIGKIIRD